MLGEEYVYLTRKGSMMYFKKSVYMLAVLGGCALLPLGSFAQNLQKPRCIDYTSIGMSSCKEHVEEAAISSTTVVTPPAVVEFQKPSKDVSKTLDERIDDFLENHGKPPREFVAFSLEPTLENALIWAQKNKEIIARNKQLADAWNQAQLILDARQKVGAEVPPLPEELMPVPDFKPVAQSEIEALAPYLSKQSGDSANLRLGAAGNLTNNQSVVGGRIGGGFDIQAKDQPISISYYFSAECPYCKKFEGELKSVMKDMKGRLEVTCVDMTPSGQAEANVLGKIDCAWRPLEVGEMERMGIKSTPSLIVDRHQGGAVERVTGFVDAKSLKDYLLGEK